MPSQSSFAQRSSFDTRTQHASPAGTPGEDPLLELARLVGADDPFADLFRAANVQRPSDPNELRGSAEVGGYADEDESYAPARQEHELGVYGEPERGRRDAGRAEAAWGSERYARDVEPAHYDDGEDWAAEAPRDLDEDAAPAGLAALRGSRSEWALPRLDPRAETRDFAARDEFDDQDGEAAGDYAAEAEEPRRGSGFRSGGAMIAAAVAGLVVLGGGGGFAYWQMSGSAESDGPPPIIKAETTPTKVVPSNPGGTDIPHQNRLVYDRVGGTGQTIQERLAAKPEEPIATVPAATSAPSTGIAIEPRRVRTVVVKPDGTMMAGAPAEASAAPVATAAAPASVADQTAALPAPAPAYSTAAALPSAQRAAPVRSLPERPVATTDVKVRPAPLAMQAPTQMAAAPAVPSLGASPSAPAVQPVAAPSRSTASLGATATGGESWSVQLASQRTEDQARAAYQGLQQKYSGVLAGQQPQLQRAELGDKGTYYRVRLAMGTRDAAVQLCANLKAAGGDCLVQKN